MLQLALQRHQVKTRVPEFKLAGGTELDGQPMLGDGLRMRRLRQTIAEVAPSNATVFVLGESGTGKELVARAVHRQSPRAKNNFVPVNMAALPANLAESVLFGHEKGAFTGADSQQRGWCELADKGTLFLDEIGEMDFALQAKLLRFLQERQIQRVGSSNTISVNVRVIAATNRDPLALIREGRLREDLYYRLNVVPIDVPPCASTAKTSRSWPSTSCTIFPRPTANASRASAATCSMPCSDTVGPETSASSKTSSSEW